MLRDICKLRAHLYNRPYLWKNQHVPNPQHWEPDGVLLRQWAGPCLSPVRDWNVPGRYENKCDGNSPIHWPHWAHQVYAVRKQKRKNKLQGVCYERKNAGIRAPFSSIKLDWPIHKSDWAMWIWILETSKTYAWLIYKQRIREQYYQCAIKTRWI